ncbi:MAG: DUF1080 domain-containing protein [Gemmataceae bacterium]
MRQFLIVAFVLAIAASSAGAQDEEGPNTLTPEQKAGGWVLMFDGDSTFGWKVTGEVRDDRGVLIIGSLSKPTTASIPVAAGELTWEYLWESRQGVEVHLKSAEGATKPWTVQLPLSGAGRVGENNWHAGRLEIASETKDPKVEAVDVSQKPGPLKRPGSYSEYKAILPSQPAVLTISVTPGEPIRLRNIKFKPAGLEPLFNGKDLSGWRTFEGGKYVSQFKVTPEGWLNVKNGPGDLQTVGQYGNFIFQGECISNGDKLNSGVFFRCIPGYQQGYEFQIHNGFKDGDRRKPMDWGTGAIYRRVPARKVVPNDQQWFSMTLFAAGNHIRTWVNGYPTVDWLDTRMPDENPRNGLRVKPGHLSIQGHDKTTDLSFRNLRIVDLSK